MAERFSVRVGALGCVKVDAPDAQRAAIAAASRWTRSLAPVLCIVTDEEVGEVTRWTVHHVEYHYARPA